MSRVTVIGAGIAGLTAAYDLGVHHGHDVTVLEAADRVGGKVAAGVVAGARVDTGADAFLARVPWARDLAAELGIDDQLVPPATGHASLLVDGELRPLPSGLVLGVPTDPVALAASGIVSDTAIGALEADLAIADGTPDPLLSPTETVGAFVRRRLGDEIHERLVDPLLGGINAGDTDQLALAVCAPKLLEAGEAGGSLARGLRRATPARSDADPLFLGHPEGMDHLTDALAAALPREPVLGVEVQCIGSDRSLQVEPAEAAGLPADALVVACPAPAAATIVRSVSPDAADGLASITYASVVMVTIALDRSSVAHPLDGSGFLIPRGGPSLMTACSWASSKWAHLADDHRVLLRVSAGRSGDDRTLAMSDDQLVTTLLAELTEPLGLSDSPVEVRVTRYPDAFPQYGPDHVATIEAVRARLEPHRIALTGAATRGVGLASCIADARETATRVDGWLR